jgi:hypothetical protein
MSEVRTLRVTGIDLIDVLDSHDHRQPHSFLHIVINILYQHLLIISLHIVDNDQ